MRGHGGFATEPPAPMADTRIPAQLQAAPARPAASARSEAVRAAQRAFFDTALAGEAQGTAPARAAASPVAMAVAPAAAPLREVRVALDPAGPAPSRTLRPGSLLDIKV